MLSVNEQSIVGRLVENIRESFEDNELVSSNQNVSRILEIQEGVQYILDQGYRTDVTNVFMKSKIGDWNVLQCVDRSWALYLWPFVAFRTLIEDCKHFPIYDSAIQFLTCEGNVEELCGCKIDRYISVYLYSRALRDSDSLRILVESGQNALFDRSGFFITDHDCESRDLSANALLAIERSMNKML